MLPNIYVFGHQVSMYALCIMAGIALGILVAIFRSEKMHCSKEDVLFASLYGILGLIAGGKILFLLTNLPWIIRNFSEIIGNTELIAALMTGGFVFYGGFIGAILGIFIYARQYHLSAGTLLEAIIPAVPLIHAFGRIGCFCAGCCYGMPASPPLGVYFMNSEIAPRDVALFPIQLLEAFFNFVIFFVMMVRYYNKETKKEALCFYLLSYGVVRFVLEFFRADAARGFLLGLSTSQWISVFLILAVFIIRKKRNYH